MAAIINIRRDQKDSFYRYKMPKLIAKIEGRGNGIKTAVPNMSDVAKALARPATYPTKYFGYELGAQTKCEAKNDRYIINGAHDAEVLQNTLDGFINKFVLCGSCLNPETTLLVAKDEILRNCLACGKRTAVDMKHKLVTFILKNPPADTGTAYDSSSKGRRDKKSGGTKKIAGDSQDQVGGDDEAKQQSDDENEEPSTADLEGHENDDEITRRINEDAAVVVATESQLEDWANDTSAEAVAARQAEMAGMSEKMARKLNLLGGDNDDSNDAVDSGADTLDQLADFVQSNKAASVQTILSKVRELSVREDKAVLVLAQVLLSSKIVQLLPQYEPLFSQLCDSEKAQRALLGGVECIVGVEYTDLKPKLVQILKQLYDLDLVDEEVFIAWHGKSSKRYVDKDVNKQLRQAATPFIDWLQTAEEEDDDDSDEE